MPREFYINDDRFWGQAKKDGNKLIVFATPEKVWYQSRQLKVNSTPSLEMEKAFKLCAEEYGSFILEGEIYYLDFEGNEHMTGATCLASNIAMGQPDWLPRPVFSAFGCLFAYRQPLTTKSAQVAMGHTIMDWLEGEDQISFYDLETAKTKEEKTLLALGQKEGGREGEVWFLKDLVTRPGKITSSRDPQFDGYVRTKYYLGIQKYRITKLEPSHAEGHTIGGFSVEDADGVARGSVGTGYSREQQKQIYRRFNDDPDNCWVLVDAQRLSIYGILRHASFKGFPEE
jgi:bifunctional non-homologous end joining protein LigD